VNAHWRKLVNKDSPYLTVWDIEGRTPLPVTIEGHAFHKVHAIGADNDEDAQVDMLFLRFKGGKKELGVKVTNCTIIERVLGTPRPDEWVGKTITLRTAECRGEPCIRVDTPPGTKLPKLIPRFRYTDSPAAKPATAEQVQP
jgi:hypothetical protein